MTRPTAEQLQGRLDICDGAEITAARAKEDADVAHLEQANAAAEPEEGIEAARAELMALAGGFDRDAARAYGVGRTPTPALTCSNGS